MINVYRVTGLSNTTHIWLGGQKEVKIVQVNNPQIADTALATSKICKVFPADILNCYILNQDYIPRLEAVVDGEFDNVVKKNVGILQKLVNAENHVEIDTRYGRVVLSLSVSNNDSVTKSQFFSDGRKYSEVSSTVFQTLTLQSKIAKLASVAKMREMYDCSWVFDDNGILIKDYKCIKNFAELNWVISELDKLEDGFDLGFDVETTGVKFNYGRSDNDRLLGFSLSWKDNQGVYIPLESKVFDCLDKQTVLKALYKHLCRLNLIAHNGQFEWKVMYHEGWTLEIGDDTLLLNFSIFPMPIKGFATLKNLSRLWFNHETWEFSQLFGGKAEPEMLVYLPEDLLMIYGCADADYARMLKYKLMEYLNESQKFPYKLDCKIIEILGKAEYYGAKKNVPQIEKKEKELIANMKVLEEEMIKYILSEGFENFKAKRISKLFEEVSKLKRDKGLDDDELDLVNRYYEGDDKLRDVFMDDMRLVLTEKAFNSDKRLQKILFEILDYPVLSYKRKSKQAKEKERQKIEEAKERGEILKPKPPTPATDEDALVTLLQYEIEPVDRFSDIVNEEGGIVIEASDLNGVKYPFCKLLLEYKNINKQLTTFYKQHRENPSEFWYYENKQAQARTSRLISTAQLIDKRTKSAIIPYDNCYGVNADYSQIEIRNMAGCANKYWTAMEKLINKEELSVYHRNGLRDYVEVLSNPETDMHRETAARMLRKAAEDVTSDERSGHKTYSFGVPYGMRAFALSADNLIKYVDNMSENRDVEVNKILQDSGVSLSKWNFSNYPIYKYLNYNRESTLIVRKDSKTDRIPPYFDGHDVGYVENDFGRRRYFYLDDMNDLKKASIFKEAGHFPIQSGSRELFFINKLNMYNKMKEMGWVENPTGGNSPKPDKFFMEIFVHDEFFGSVDVSIHPYDVVKLIYSNCFIKLKYHPTYFMGINFVNNWCEGKKGTNELPVMLVKEIYEVPEKEYPEYDGNGYFIVRDVQGAVINKLWVIDYFAQLVKDYELRRVLQEVEGFGNIPLEEVPPKITSYYVKPLIVKYGVKFGCKKSNTMCDMLRVILENRDYDFLKEKVKCSRLIAENKVEDEETSEEEMWSLFDEPGEFTDSEVITSLNLSEIMRKSKETVFDEFSNQVIKEESSNYIIHDKERKMYQESNFDGKKKDPRVIISISGKLILNLNSVPHLKQHEIVNEIKKRYEDPNGSLFEVMNALGLKRQPFRIFNFDRESIESILETIAE